MKTYLFILFLFYNQEKKMKKNLTRAVSVFAVIGFFCISAFAITWFPQEFTCPIDKEKNTFQVVGSFGSYIYSYPSKYQFLFFPRTDSPTFLCAKNVI